jgi:hypothetical protein
VLLPAIPYSLPAAEQLRQSMINEETIEIACADDAEILFLYLVVRYLM